LFRTFIATFLLEGSVTLLNVLGVRDPQMFKETPH